MHAMPKSSHSYPQCNGDIQVLMAVIHSSLEPTHSNSKLSRTHFRTCFLNSGIFSRHNLAASGFAGDSSFGLESIEMTERRMVSGVWTGDHRSAADS
jgi:hypothetical protein